MSRAPEAELPALYRPWVASLLGGPIPAESEATCGDCAMLESSTAASASGVFFDPRTKCCTYVPAIPNFLVGRALLDESPDGAAGRATIEARIARGVGVTPAGLDPPPTYLVLYGSATDAFGQSAAMRCPHYLAESGGCGIWRHRNAICSTWYCKHVRGAVGQRFWTSLRHLMMTVERSLVAFCLRELNPGVAIVHDLFAGADRRGSHSLSANDLDGVPDPARRARLWGPYAGREAEFYRAAGRLVDAFAWTDVVRVGGAHVELAATAVEASYRELLASDVPDRLRPMPVEAAPVGADRVRVVGYTRLDPLEMPRALYDVLHVFDGRSTRAALRTIASSGGPSIDVAVVRRLIDHGVLGDAQPSETVTTNTTTIGGPLMAKANKNKKRPAVKDLKPKSARNVKGGETGTVNVTEFTITKKTDVASPKLQ